MKRTIIIFLSIFISLQFCAQTFKPFYGKLVYSININDTTMRKFVPDTQMTIYSNDTIIRIENESQQLGKQVLIHHTILNKSYLLLDLPMGKYAIQTDHNVNKKTENDSVNKGPKFTFKKKFGRVSILNRKANKLMVSNVNFEKPLAFLYFKNYAPKYVNAFENFPGLPVKYYLATEDGILVYQLIQIEEKTQNRDLFGIPSDYKKLSFDDFIKEIMPDAMHEKK